ncbi:MAG TPA: GNAT family N-acetyltransferase [Thermoleophilaceae bacterium]|nr:GNAT family N-acetyltransferase [Thermoleophilaceae bacterium]
MNVRSAEPRDFDAVAFLLHDLGRREVTDETRDRCRELYAAQVSDPSVDHLVAEDDDGEIVGFCSLHFRKRLNYTTPEAWVPDLIVRDAQRRNGVGKALLEHAENRAIERGCWALSLESAHHRVEAHRFYGAFGMRDMGKSFRKLLG